VKEYCERKRFNGTSFFGWETGNECHSGTPNRDIEGQKLLFLSLIVILNLCIINVSD